jgi:hypothetical protein
MRTTLDIDDDVLAAAKELAAAEKASTGKVISELARAALRRGSPASSKTRNGLPLLPGRRTLVTAEQVDRLLDEE